MGTINGGAGADTLSGTVGDDSISGLAGNDSLSGLAGNDTLDGGTGNDTMAGGTEDDVYIVDSASDSVVEAAGQGTDTVQTTLAALNLGVASLVNIENLTYIGAGNFNGTGNAANNTITGGVGNDTFNGSTGNDSIDGGAGNDLFNGGNADGNDTISGGNGNDTIDDWQGANSLDGGAGNDQFQDVSYNAGTTPGADTIAGGTGQNTFVLTVGNIATSQVADVITDFKPGVGGDVVDISSFVSGLTGYPANTNPFVDGFFRLFQSGSDTVLQFDRDGPTNGQSWTTILTLQNTTATGRLR